MTTKELAEAANNAPDNSMLPEVSVFLRDATAFDIQVFIHYLHFLTKPRNFEFAKIALQVRIAKEQAVSANKMERFTWWLVCLTWALIFIGVIQIILMLCWH